MAFPLIPVLLGVGVIGLVKTTGDTIEQTGDAVEQSGNAALKFAVLAVISAGVYLVITRKKA